MCRNELGEFYRWWIFVGVRPLQRVHAPAALVLPAHRKLYPNLPRLRFRVMHGSLLTYFSFSIYSLILT